MLFLFPLITIHNMHVTHSQLQTTFRENINKTHENCLHEKQGGGVDHRSAEKKIINALQKIRIFFCSYLLLWARTIKKESIRIISI